MAGWGEALALLGAVAFAGSGAVVAKGATQKGSGDNGALLSVIITAVAAGGIWLATPAMAIPVLQSECLLGSAWFALSGFVTIFLGRSLLYQSIGYLGATRASAVRRLNPFFLCCLPRLFSVRKSVR
jgi:drug/metabolite transporter (DMT)-like permease